MHVLVGMVYRHSIAIIRAIIIMGAHTMHGGHNQWVWSLARSTIKCKILVNQEINGCFKAGSSDQEQILITVADGSTGYIAVTSYPLEN